MPIDSKLWQKYKYKASAGTTVSSTPEMGFPSAANCILDYIQHQHVPFLD